MSELDSKAVCKSLFEFSTNWCNALNGGQLPKQKVWNLSDGHIEAFVWNNQFIPKTGLSFLEMDGTFRVGLNMYVRNPLIPDGSFALLHAQQEGISFIGGVLELFPTVRIEEDIDRFMKALNNIAQNHKMDSTQLRQGLARAFIAKKDGSNLGAEAGFNFYRAGLEATVENLVFAQEAFKRSLKEYQVLLNKRAESQSHNGFKEKELSWKKHLRYMKEDDIGIKMALEQGIPIDFFSFSTFPPD